jgi:nicotinamidase-related amidase
MERMIITQLKDILGPSRTCLVVWDVQNGLVKSIFNREEFVSNLKNLLGAARKANVPIVYTRITPLLPEFQSDWTIFRNMQRMHVDDPKKLPRFMAPGSPEAEIYADVAPSNEDVVLAKHAASIFIGTNFEYLMRNRHIETLVFTGISTEIGVDSSVRDAGNRGFYPFVASDCVSSSSKEMHDAALKVLPSVSLVMPSGSIISQWA